MEEPSAGFSAQPKKTLKSYRNHPKFNFFIPFVIDEWLPYFGGVEVVRLALAATSNLSARNGASKELKWSSKWNKV